jgi:chromosome partitioning protein
VYFASQTAKPDLGEFVMGQVKPLVQSRIMAIANQKGGVGKTTTTINLATALAAIGEKVLIVDIDPQGNASTGLGIPRDERENSVYDVLIADLPIDQAIFSSTIPNLDVVPSTADLTGAELELIDLDNRSHRLANALKPIESVYDYILFDCPPSLNLLTLNAFVAAQAVIVPLQCEFFALEGLSMLIRTIERVRNSLNPGLEIQGVVLTMFDKRNKLSDQVAQDVRDFLGKTVYDTVIPRNVRVSEAPSHGKPVLIYDHRCAGSQAYIKLASEVIKRERDLVAA